MRLEASLLSGWKPLSREQSDHMEIEPDFPVEGYTTRCVSPRTLTYGQEVPCGACTPCLEVRQRAWASRIIAESFEHASTLFVTLTYADAFVPRDELGRLVLRREDLQKVWKGLRNRGLVFRYFGVGEYGDQTFRPHYHAAFFGLRVEDEPKIREVWPRGFIQVDELTPERARYLARYTVKKMTRGHDPRLQGRPPEFSIMSRRPGIGTGFAETVARTVRRSPTMSAMAKRDRELPTNGYRHQGRVHPLSPFVKQKARAALSLPDKAADRGGPKLRNATEQEMRDNQDRDYHRSVRARITRRARL